MNRSLAAVTAGLLTCAIAVPAFAASYDLGCMQNAIDRRENSLIIANDDYYIAVRSAMIIRKDALKSAWGIQDSQTRKDAIRNAGRIYADAEKNARRSKRDAEKAAAKTYKTDANNCEL